MVDSWIVHWQIVFDFLYGERCFHMKNSCISLGKTSWFCLVIFLGVFGFLKIFFLTFRDLFLLYLDIFT